MQKFGKILLGCAAPFALAGAALAAGGQVHILNVALPDGSVAHVRYSGDVAPRVIVLPARRMVVPMAFVPPDIAAHFRAMDAMMAGMHAQSEALMRQATALSARTPAAPGQVRYTASQSLPAGVVRYSFFSSTNGSATCSHSVQVTSMGVNRPAKVVSQTSGNCAGAPSPKAVAAPTPATPQRPGTIKFVPIRPAVLARSKDTI